MKNKELAALIKWRHTMMRLQNDLQALEVVAGDAGAALRDWDVAFSAFIALPEE